MSSGDTKPERSGSSPYQKIHSSLAAVRESGGGAGEGAIPRSKIPAPGADALAAAEPELAGVAATRRQTQRMSPAKHREKLDSTGSSKGVPPKPPATSPHTSFRHLMPQREVCKSKSKISETANARGKRCEPRVFLPLPFSLSLSLGEVERRVSARMTGHTVATHVTCASCLSLSLSGSLSVAQSRDNKLSVESGMER